MPPKPRPHGKKPPPRPRSPRPPTGGVDRRTMLIAAIGVVVAIAVVAAVLVLAGGDEGGGADARAALEAAGCTLSATPAVLGTHDVATPEDTSDEWNTDPPTSGPHNQVTAIWGTYDEPVNQAQLVHNLEHGGVALQYGDDVPAETVQQLKTFVQEERSRGTLLAPYPALGDEIAMGAWVTEDEPGEGTGYLAKCTRFDRAAFDAFFDRYQFKGPERLPADVMLPGQQ